MDVIQDSVIDLCLLCFRLADRQKVVSIVDADAELRSIVLLNNGDFFTIEVYRDKMLLEFGLEAQSMSSGKWTTSGMENW